MSLLYLIEQYYRIRLAAYCLGELTALIIANVSRRRTDESAHAVLLLILTHIDTSHHGLVVEQIVGQCLGELCLTHTGGAKEDETCDWTLRILKTGTTAANSVRHCCDGLVLTDDTLVKLLFEVQQLLALALHHAGYRDTSPARYHLCNIIGSNLLTNQTITVTIHS